MKSLNNVQDAYSTLKDFKIRNRKRIIIAHLNIYSMQNNFELLKCLISNNIDTLTIAEKNITIASKTPISFFEASV